MSSPRRRAVAAMALSGAISAALISTPAASAGIADGTAFPTQSATPHLPDSTSANWAGYVASGGGYTSVSAAWTQPGVSCTSQTSYASFWVGLDGDGSTSVEQIGTAADCSGGSASYAAWYEMYPGGPVRIAGQVSPGDAVHASVSYRGSGRFTLTLGDRSKGWSHTVGAHLDNPALAGAEAIAEAPSDASGVLRLSDFGAVRFTGVSADGAALSAFRPAPVTMADGGTTKAYPGPISPGGDFTVTWHAS